MAQSTSCLIDSVLFQETLLYVHTCYCCEYKSLLNVVELVPDQ